jgi:hypothetical protein
MHVPTHVSVRRRLLGLAASAALGTAALTIVSVAPAAASVTSPGACDASPLSQPFQRFGDAAFYKLLPGGDFEGGAAGWSLTGSAGVDAGGETVGATGGSSSLGLSGGDTAQSPATCVNAAYPSLRFFARSDNPGSILSVSVVYQTPGGPITLPVGAVSPGRNWAPTTSMPTLAGVGTLLAGGQASVALRFTQLAGSSQIDDVYVDPHTIH